MERRSLAERPVDALRHLGTARARRDVGLQRLAKVRRRVGILSQYGLQSEDDHRLLAAHVAGGADGVLELAARHSRVSRRI
jgi:hypothetical protein